MTRTTFESLVRREQRRSLRRIGQIAAALHVHRTTLHRWMVGSHEPEERILGVLAKELHVSEKRLREAIRVGRGKEAIPA